MDPWRPITKPIDLKHLGKLAEELNECGAATARCIIQGMDGCEPETGKPNRQWLQEEIADVLANVELVIDHFGLDWNAIEQRGNVKYDRSKVWHGQLQDMDNGSASQLRGWPDHLP